MWRPLEDLLEVVPKATGGLCPKRAGRPAGFFFSGLEGTLSADFMPIMGLGFRVSIDMTMLQIMGSWGNKEEHMRSRAVEMDLLQILSWLRVLDFGMRNAILNGRQESRVLLEATGRTLLVAI